MHQRVHSVPVNRVVRPPISEGVLLSHIRLDWLVLYVRGVVEYREPSGQRQTLLHPLELTLLTREELNELNSRLRLRRTQMGVHRQAHRKQHRTPLHIARHPLHTPITHRNLRAVTLKHWYRPTPTHNHSHLPKREVTTIPTRGQISVQRSVPILVEVVPERQPLIDGCRVGGCPGALRVHPITPSLMHEGEYPSPLRPKHHRIVARGQLSFQRLKIVEEGAPIPVLGRRGETSHRKQLLIVEHREHIPILRHRVELTVIVEGVDYTRYKV